MLHLCRDALIGQKLRLLSFRQWTCLVSSSAHPFPLESALWSNFHPPKTFNLIDLKEGDNWPSHTCHTKWTWKCDPRRPRWMLCQAVKKHKLCSSWRVKKAYSVNMSSRLLLLHCFSLVIILHIKYLHPLPLVSKPVCAAPLPSSLLPWRLICNFVRLRILGNVHTLFCNATPVPWRTGRTKVALVELPTVNMFGFFFCTPFPLRILAGALSYPGRISTLQKLLIL